MNEQQTHVIAGLKANKEAYGKHFCPCVPSYLYVSENAKDFICKCKEFREGRGCHCGLFTDREVSQCK